MECAVMVVVAVLVVALEVDRVVELLGEAASESVSLVEMFASSVRTVDEVSARTVATVIEGVTGTAVVVSCVGS